MKGKSGHRNSFLRLGRDRERRPERGKNKSHKQVTEDRDFARTMIPPKNKGYSVLDILGSVAIASGLTIGGVYKFNDVYLNPSDFQNTRWIQVENPDGIIWDNYKKSGIPQNGNNWAAYQIEVRDRNGCLQEDTRNKCLTGKIDIPNFN